MERSLVTLKAKLHKQGWKPVMDHYRSKYSKVMMEADPHDVGSVFEGNSIPFHNTKLKLWILHKNGRVTSVHLDAAPNSKESYISTPAVLASGAVVAGSLLLVHNGGSIQHVGTVFRETAGKVSDGVRDIRDAFERRRAGPANFDDWDPDYYM